MSGGEIIHPAQAENVIRSHPDVQEVAVVGVWTGLRRSNVALNSQAFTSSTVA